MTTPDPRLVRLVVDEWSRVDRTYDYTPEQLRPIERNVYANARARYDAGETTERQAIPRVQSEREQKLLLRWNALLPHEQARWPGGFTGWRKFATLVRDPGEENWPVRAGITPPVDDGTLNVRPEDGMPGDGAGRT